MKGPADKLLVDTLRALKQDAPNNTIPLGSIRDATVTADQLRTIKRDQGLVVVADAFSATAMGAAREAARVAWWTDVAPQLKPEERPAANTPLFELPWPTGIIGNASFGYLFAQPETKEQMPTLSFSTGSKTTVALGSGYNANLALISHPDSQLTMAIVFAVSGHPTGMVSHDSCKIHRGGLTTAHVDIYEDNEQRIQRMQAMGIGAGEGTVRLCYLRFSNHPNVKWIITKLIGTDIYGTQGFQTVPKDKQSVLLKCFADAGCIQYGSPGDLVMWEPGVIHLEMKLLEDGSLIVRADNKTTTERYIVGTHNPIGFTPRELTEAAYIADRGFFFHPYNKANHGTAAGTNSVHRKKTQFKKPRARSDDERQRIAAIQQELIDAAPVDDAIAAMPQRKRHCLGVSQPVDEMYDDLDARRVHNQ